MTHLCTSDPKSKGVSGQGRSHCHLLPTMWLCSCLASVLGAGTNSCSADPWPCFACPVSVSTSPWCREHPRGVLQNNPWGELSPPPLLLTLIEGNGLVAFSLEPRLSPIVCPHLTVTGESPPSLSKELSSTLAGVSDVSFDSDHQFPLDELKIDPLTLDGLHMLNDPDMVLADPATEDTFRMDRL